MSGYPMSVIVAYVTWDLVSISRARWFGHQGATWSSGCCQGLHWGSVTCSYAFGKDL